uniref:Uncharacterized protein n=1 Tax=Cacopsylla melanoneura TaxID=428564 RepID=A0A8D8M4Q2_9HEMI
MNDNRTVKRTKSSRTKELEENDDDEDDSERRKATDTWPEVNGNIVHDTYQTKNKHYPEMNSTSRIDNFKYGSRSEGHSPYETARTSTNAQYEMSLLNGKLSMNSGKRHGRKNKEEHCNTDDNSSCCGERIQNENACPSECEYCTNSIANNVKNSYWHCLEVEQYSNKHNTWSPCNSGSNNVNRMQVVDDSVLCEKSDCIYLPFENVTKEKSCFRKNCSCNQKYLIKNLKSKEKMTKKNEILLSPSGLSNEDYSACNCNVPNCCENNAKQSDIYFRTQSHQSSYQLNDDGACGSKEKRKSNHFKEKVNQVLPNLMASVVHNQNQIENQNEEISRGNSSYQLCSENIVHGNSCENCSECNNSTCSPNSNVNKNHGVTNSLIPIDSLVPNNNVPLQNRNHDLCPDPNIFPTHSGYAEKSEGSQNDVKCTEEQFLNIKIKLSSDNNQKQEGSSCTSTYITESASDECSNKSATIESNLERESPKDVENAPENDEKRPQTNSEILEVNKLLVENMPTSSKYLTSPLRNPRKKTNREQRPKSIPERKAKRQFYTPYEEALSSLLWQPYDCRNSGLATMEVSDMSDSDDQTRRNVHRSRRKSGPRVSKHDRADHRPAETNNLASYVFDIPPEYALMEGFQSFDYSQFISECDSSLLCRNCKINLFVEDNDEFRGKYFCFNCKELKRFLNENNTMTDSELMTQFKNEKLRASLDGACGLSHYPISVPSASSSILPNPLVPNFYLKGQVRTKHHSKCKSNSNELGKRPKQNQDNDTCSSTLSSSYSSSSSLSSLELAPLGAPPSTELELESGGSGTALAQSSAVPCRVNVCQVESRELHSDTSVSTQNKKLKSPRSNNNVDSKMLVNISNSNHNLSLSQSNLLSSSSNNLISVVTSNPCDNSSENLVNIVSCYRAVPVTTSSGGEPNQNTHHVPTSDNQTPNPTYTNTSSNLIQSNGVGSGSSHLKNVNRCVSSVSVSANVNGLPPPPQGVGVAKPLPTTSRTFISTEAQTDEIILNRDQRRRERRERRQQRRLAQQLQQWPSVPPQDRIPDILHSHVPPPYSTLPLGVLPCSTSLHHLPSFTLPFLTCLPLATVAPLCTTPPVTPLESHRLLESGSRSPSSPAGEEDRVCHGAAPVTRLKRSRKHVAACP